MATLLLDRGAVVDKESGGFTALMRASRSDHADVVQLLLKAGADPRQTVQLHDRTYSALRSARRGSEFSRKRVPSCCKRAGAMSVQTTPMYLVLKGPPTNNGGAHPTTYSHNADSRHGAHASGSSTSSTYTTTDTTTSFGSGWRSRPFKRCEGWGCEKDV